MSAESIEEIMIDRLVPDLTSQGYEVFIRPGRQLIPAFLGTYRPDIIALRDDKNLVYEIKSNIKDSQALLQNLTDRFKGQHKWEFRVVGVSRSEEPQSLPVQTPERILQRIEEISKLLESSFVDAAMLICWSTIEAIGRRLMSDELSRAQTPRRLVQALASQGHITPDEADFLRTLVGKRNQLAHGGLTTDINRTDVESSIEVLRSMYEIMMSQSHSPALE